MCVGGAPTEEAFKLQGDSVFTCSCQCPTNRESGGTH